MHPPDRTTAHSRSRVRRLRQRRGGGVALWFLIGSPLFIAALVMVIDLGFLWLTRIELENAVAAAALAGARSIWDAKQDDEGTARRDAARQLAGRYLGANRVAGTSLQLYSGGATPPVDDRALLVERVVLLGNVDLTTPVTFQLTPGEITNRGCHVKAEIAVDSLCLGIEGFYTLEAAASAVNEGEEVDVSLIRVDAFE